MKLEEFVLRRHEAWRRLEALVQQADRDIAVLAEADVRDLGLLYRQATSDLALAQRDFPGERVTVYLNQLVARAHPVIYRGEPLLSSQAQRFFGYVFPVLYRRLWPYTLGSTLLFLLPALMAFVGVWRQPESIYALAGVQIRDLVETVESGRLWTDIAPQVRSAGASVIFTNNIQVMFLTFAGGVTAGLLTAWVLVTNGVQFGALFGLLQHHGMSGGLAQFVVAHGFIELSVIFLAGGCGLYMADGILRPGLAPRSSVLAERARLAVQAILGCIPLLVIAGLIEGFISPSGLPWPVKVVVGIGTGLILHAYWWLGGRKRASAASLQRFAVSHPPP